MNTLLPGETHKPNTASRQLRVRLAQQPLILAVLTAFALYLLLQFLERVAGVLFLFLLALILATVMTPIVQRVHRVELPPRQWHIPKAFIVLLIYIVLCAVVVGLITLAGSRFLNEVGQFLSGVPDLIRAYLQQLRQAYMDTGLPPALLPTPEDIAIRVRDFSFALLSDIGIARTFAGDLFWMLFEFFFVLILALFFVASAERLMEFWLELFPPTQRDKMREITSRVGSRISGWLLGQLTVAFSIGVLTAIGLSLLGIPYAILFGLLTAFLELVPILGAAAMSIPVFLIGLSISPPIALIGGAYLIALAELEAHAFQPLIMGRTSRVPPLLIVMVIPLGLALYGPLGALVAVPVAAALQVIVTEIVLPWWHQRIGTESISLPAPTLPEPAERNSG